MLRRITGFHPDDEGHWVAELDCLHNQHVRHRPPWEERPWVVDEAGRRNRLGQALDCPLCDRAELPDGLVVARTAGPFDPSNLPAGLRRRHRVAASTWGRLRVLEGRVGLDLEVEPPLRRVLDAADSQALPPSVPHLLQPEGPFLLAVDFLTRPGPASPG
ncbi:MAG TPA: DUF3565 domain-containing protein [Acidimicrobiales bacterium]|nr:DUF3565 domain-containing protein [Acidimicrobiales bacterium]